MVPAIQNELRRGITLLEVTIAIMVLSIGLLGVASLLPVGQLELAQALRADRASTLGRAAFRNLHAQGWLMPQWWVYPTAAGTGRQVVGNLVSGSNSLWSTPSFNPSPAGTAAPPPYSPIVLDPLLIGSIQASGNTAAMGAVMQFPYAVPKVSMYATPIYLPRATLSPTPAAASAPLMPFGPADRLFRSNDDIAYTTPTDKSYKPLPQRIFGPTGPFGTNLNTGALGYASNGDYSWLAIIAPDVYESLGAQALNSLAYPGSVQQTFRYTAHVVVFYQRDLTVATTASGKAPAERVVQINFSPAAAAGSAVNLASVAYLSAPLATSTDQAAEYLDVRAEQWLMVTTQVPAAQVLQQPTLATLPFTKISWYRVISASPTLDTSNRRIVRLAGPEWVTNAGSATAACVILDGVVGVYEKSYQMDGHSSWSAN